MTPPRRNGGIDALRGLAIVLVVLHHTGLRFPLRRGVLDGMLPRWLLNASIYNGYEAVFVFFVISGFVITARSLDHWHSLGALDVRAFYRRRAWRILPCLLLLLVVLSALHLAGVNHYVIDNPAQSLGRALAAALGLHLNWYEGTTGYLPASWDVLWSLSIEEMFYLAFPLACLLFGRSRWLVPLLALLALSLPFTRAALGGNEIWQEKAYLPGMSAIAMGVLAALGTARWPAPRRSTVTLLLIFGSVGLLAVLFAESLLWARFGDGCILLLTLASAALVAGCHWREQAAPATPWHGLAWLRSFGFLSYEVYLCHMFAVWWMVDAARALGVSERWGVVWYVPALALSWLLGAAVHRFYAQPIANRSTRPRPARIMAA